MDGSWYIKKVLSVAPKHPHNRLSAPEMGSKAVVQMVVLGTKQSMANGSKIRTFVSDSHLAASILSPAC